jgi:glycosyltransferase involved in cell wall biosynthesis
VALVVTSAIAGGAEEYLYRLYGGLVASGRVEVDLIGGLPAWPEGLGGRVPTPVIGKLTRRTPLLPQLQGGAAFARAVLAAVGTGGYDLVHVQYFREKLTLVRRLARATPVVWTEHGPLPTNFPPGGRQLLRLQAARASVIAVSEGVAGSLREAGIRSAVVGNPLPSPAHPDGRPLDSRDPGRPLTVVYAGRLHASKRIDLLLAAARVSPSVRFVVAGDGPERADLSAGAPGNVEFLGFVDDVRALLGAADAVVIPSGRAAREGSPMVMLEARAWGIPVLIAEDCHAAAEGVTLGARSFPPVPEALADAIRALGEHPPREQLPEWLRESRSEQSWLDAHWDVMRAAAARAGRRDSEGSRV